MAFSLKWTGMPVIHSFFFFFNIWMLPNRGSRTRARVNRGEVARCCPCVWLAFLFPVPSLESSPPLDSKERQSILRCLFHFRRDHHSPPSMVSSLLPGKHMDRMRTSGNKPVPYYHQAFWAIHKSTSACRTGIGDPGKTPLSVSITWTIVNVLSIFWNTSKCLHCGVRYFWKIMVGSTANSDFLDKHFAYKQPSNFFFF